MFNGLVFQIRIHQTEKRRQKTTLIGIHWFEEPILNTNFVGYGTLYEPPFFTAETLNKLNVN